MRFKMRHKPYLLAADSAQLVEQTIAQVAAHRHWPLDIVKARTNHVHIVARGEVAPERMMNDFKAWSTRRLREHAFARPDQNVWAEHGSTPHLFTPEQVLAAINYVKNWQGGPLQKTWAELEMVHAASASAASTASEK
jgi:REP element-mobilizing transposase RayT